MTNDVDSTNPSGKSFFSTLPGIITAVAGLITALGGFILILNKTGCISPKTSATGQEQQASKSNANPNTTKPILDTTPGKNISYNPSEIKVILKSVSFKITSAQITLLPNKETVLTLKLKCVNDSKYEYHFYAHNLRVKIGDDNYAAEPGSPSESYESVAAYSFKNLEYNFKLPPGTKQFNLTVYDEKEEIGSSVFTLK